MSSGRSVGWSVRKSRQAWHPEYEEIETTRDTVPPLNQRRFLPSGKTKVLVAGCVQASIYLISMYVVYCLSCCYVNDFYKLGIYRSERASLRYCIVLVS